MNNTDLTSKILEIQRAIIFATLKHNGQVRKGTNIPYIVHPMEVMQILTSFKCTNDVIIAGILHDTLEDTETTPEEIKNNFGSKICEMVETESEDKSKTWKERKQTTIDSLNNMNSYELNTKGVICLADKLSNIKSMLRDKLEIGSKLWERFNARKDDIKWYYESILNVFKEKSLNYDITEFESVIKSVFED